MSRIPSRTIILTTTAFTFSAIALYWYKNNATPHSSDNTNKLAAYFFPAIVKRIKDLEAKVKGYEDQLAAQSIEVAALKSGLTKRTQAQASSPTLKIPTTPTLFSQPSPRQGREIKSPGSGSDFDDVTIDPQQKPDVAPEAAWYSRFNPFHR